MGGGVVTSDVVQVDLQQQSVAVPPLLQFVFCACSGLGQITRSVQVTRSIQVTWSIQVTRSVQVTRSIQGSVCGTGLITGWM